MGDNICNSSDVCNFAMTLMWVRPPLSNCQSHHYFLRKHLSGSLLTFEMIGWGATTANLSSCERCHRTSGMWNRSGGARRSESVENREGDTEPLAFWSCGRQPPGTRHDHPIVALQRVHQAYSLCPLSCPYLLSQLVNSLLFIKSTNWEVMSLWKDVSLSKSPTVL